MALVLSGRQGKTVMVEGDTVIIRKKAGIFATEREKILPMRNITSVEVKEPGAFVGFIQFSIAGGKSRDSSYTLTGGSFDAVSDENSVVFTGQDQYRIALEIKSYIRRYVENNGTSGGSRTSAADEILKLKSLLDQGILTQAEFDAKKKQLLGI